MQQQQSQSVNNQQQQDSAEWVAEPFEGGGQAAPAAPQEEWVAETVDPEFDLKPEYANGLSPAAPINKSPLDIADRAKLSFGNEAGKEAFLKQKFGNVAKDADGNFIVQKDGLWYRTDAKNFEDVDAWKVTKGLLKFAAQGMKGLGGNLADVTVAKLTGKDQSMLAGDEVATELAGDYADLTKETAAVSAGLLTGGAATAGLGLIGGAAATGAGIATANTSLGRAVGTYEASLEDQVKDIAFETAFNVLGVGIPLGVKPTGKWIGEKIPLLAKAYKGMDDAGKALLKNTWGRLTVGADKWDVLEQNADELASAMKRFSPSGKDASFEQLAQLDSMKQVEKLSKLAPRIESKMYQKMSDQIIRATPDNFVAPIGDAVVDVYHEAATAGLGTLVMNGKRLSQTETLEAFAKGTFPKGARFVMRTQDDLLKEMQASGKFGEFADLATNKQAYRQIMDAFRQIHKLSLSKPLSGKDGAKQLLDFQKVTNRITYTLKQQGVKERNSLTQSFAKKLNDRLKGRFEKTFDAFTPKTSDGRSLYTALNEEYTAAKRALNVLENATKNKANPKGLERFANMLVADGKRNVTEKEALRQLEETARRHGLDDLGSIQEARKALRINDAAVAFNPLAKPGFIGKGTQTVFAGSLGATALGLGAGLPGAALAVGIGGAATSPRLAYTMMQGKNYISSLSTKQLEMLRQNPELLQGLIQTTLQTPMVEEGVKQKLLNGGGGTPP